MSNSFTNQVLAQIELWKNSADYKNEVYVLPKHLDEKVARLHLERIGAQITELTDRSNRNITVTNSPCCQIQPARFVWRAGLKTLRLA